MTHEMYMALGTRKSVLCMAPGWRLERTRADSMHCVNLGIAMHVIGNALWFLTTEKAYLVFEPAVHHPLPPGASSDDILKDLQLRFKRWLSDHGLACSCKTFSKKRIKERPADHPMFKCKAAQSPRIIGWLADITMSYKDRCPEASKEFAGLVASCVWGLAQYFHVLREGNRFFTDSEVTDLETATTTFLYSYSELARLSPDQHMWHHIPKLHQMHHILLDSRLDHNNPRFYHCFSDEDLVGQMLRTARAGHSLTVVDSALTNYMIGLLERLKYLDPGDTAPPVQP